jgi:hypothetical protein
MLCLDFWSNKMQSNSEKFFLALDPSLMFVFNARAYPSKALFIKIITTVIYGFP